MIDTVLQRRGPHTPGPKPKYSLEQLHQAIVGYLKKEGSLYELERRYGVPKSTLWDKIKEVRENGGAIEAGGRGLNLDEGTRKVPDGLRRSQMVRDNPRRSGMVSDGHLGLSRIPRDTNSRFDLGRGVLWGAGLLGAGLISWQYLGLRELWQDFMAWRGSKREVVGVRGEGVNMGKVSRWGGRYDGLNIA